MLDRGSLNSRPSRRLPQVLGAVGFVVGLVIAFLLAGPKVIEVSPLPGSTQVSAMAPIQIVFNRDMDIASVGSRLSIDPPRSGVFEWQETTLYFRPDSAWPEGELVTVHLGSGARSTQRLPILTGRTWSFEIGIPRLVYLWPSSGLADLYAHPHDGGERSRLTESASGVRQFSLASDGASLAYAAESSEGGWELRILVLSTLEDRLIFSCGPGIRCDSPALSPQGRYLAFERSEYMTGAGGQQVEGPTRVWAIDLDGGQDPYPIGPETHVSSSPFWSPTRWLAFYDHAIRAFVLVDAGAGPEPPAFTYIPSEMGNLGAWSPDGGMFVFPEITFETTGLSPTPVDERVIFFSHLIQVEISSGDRVDLSGDTPGAVEDASPAYSPSGERIAFSRKYLDRSRWTLGRQLWIMDADGSGSRQVTDEDDFNHSALTWSRDGSRLAYMRFNLADMAEPAEIWVLDVESGEAHRLVVGGYQPAWIP